MNNNYEKLIERITRTSGLEKNEIEKKVSAKQEKISGLISKEGAAQIVASELGISLDSEKSKINELAPGMKRVNVIGKVINLFPVRSFTREGEERKVANLQIADETANTKVVLWDTNHINLIETGKIIDGSVIEILNASSRDNEVHLGNFSELKLSKEVFETVQTEKSFKEKNIKDFKISDEIKLRAFIVQAFEPRFFNVCSDCKKKVVNEGENFICQEHGKIVPEKRSLMNIVLDDGTESIRSVLFHEKLKDLGILDPEKFSEEEKQKLLGKEMVFSGVVRLNKFFNNPELTIDSAKEINVDDLILKLEEN
jgi:ssDNA-binding replication factor A large subunit